LTIPAVAYSGDSMATARIQMSNFERLLTRLKGEYLENHSCCDELDLMSIEFIISFGILKKFFEIPAVAYSADSSKYLSNFAKTKKKRKSF
jgi:hypothetical protein